MGRKEGEAEKGEWWFGGFELSSFGEAHLVRRQERAGRIRIRSLKNPELFNFIGKLPADQKCIVS